MEGNNIDILKSCPSTVISFVKFTNRTQHRVRLYWVDYHGQRVCYCKALKPNDHFSMKTFVGHPWIACESRYKHSLCFGASRDLVYFPVASDLTGDVPSQALVDIMSPHKRLSTICLHFVHRHLVNKAGISQLEITRKSARQLESLFEDQDSPDTPIVMHRVP